MQQFIDLNCILFSTSENGECTLEHTEVHKKFQSLVESLLEEHLKDLGLSNEEFFEICLKKEELKDIVVDYLLPMDDFLGNYQSFSVISLF